MGKHCDLSDWDHSMVAGARQIGLTILETDFLEFTQNATKNNNKNPVSSNSAGVNTLWLKQVRGGQAGTRLVQGWYKLIRSLP